MILVAGGTGTLGTLLVRRLTDRGLAVRVLTRDPARANDLSAEVVEGDVRDRASVDKAMTDVSTVVAAVHGFAGPGHVSPASVDRDGNINLIDAASNAHAAVVLMSIVGASPDSPMELFRAKYTAEHYLQHADVPWTIVRATAYVETWASIMGEPLAKNDKTMVFGRGDNPINFVSASDVAALVDLAVVDPRLRGRAIDLGGPANLTFNEFAAVLIEAINPDGSVRHVPRAVLRVIATVMRGVKPELARMARAALVMDTTDMMFDASPTRAEFPGLPNTDVTEAVSLRV